MLSNTFDLYLADGSARVILKRWQAVNDRICLSPPADTWEALDKNLEMLIEDLIRIRKLAGRDFRSEAAPPPKTPP